MALSYESLFNYSATLYPLDMHAVALYIYYIMEENKREKTSFDLESSVI